MHKPDKTRGIMGTRRRALTTLAFALILSVAAEVTYAMVVNDVLETAGILPALAVFSLLAGSALGVQRAQEGGSLASGVGRAIPWLVLGAFFAFWALAATVRWTGE